jgi:peptide/nickel transport system substrate-binding protein
VTGAVYISIYVNPVPNAAPYTFTTNDGKDTFNPFAIQQVRFALNYLINRKQIVDQIMLGAGVPMFTPVTPGQPNSSRYGLIASKFGFTATGNEKKALADIQAGMEAAAALPENKGKLFKGDQWWMYNGDPVTIKFVIRADDPTLRVPEGRYIADQIEKAGIKVDRLEYDRTKAFATWRGTDPKDYGWNLYTEGWIGGQTYAFWDTSISQMYAPWFSNMPGGGNSKFWNYQQDTVDKLTGDAVNGRVKDAAEYYDDLMKATELGIKDSVRVFVAAQTTYLATNKARFNGRMAYGIGDGFNKWSLYTADVKPEATGPDKGKKVLRMTDFSSASALFVSAWDPVGPDGFSDVYSSGVTKALSDMEMEANPVTGIPMQLRATYTGLKTDIDTSVSPMVGKIAVPAGALLWNAMDQKWESGYVYKDLKGDGSEYGYQQESGITAYSSATFAFKLGKWQDGRAIDINDYRYALSFPYDAAVKKSDTDKVYEETYANSMNVNLPRYKGFVFNKNNTITVYADANYPMDQPSLAQLMAPSLMVEASNYGSIVPWEILEALKAIVSEGSASNTAYVYNSNGDYTEVDLLSEKCVADIKAKLQDFITEERVPTALKGFVTPAQAVADYKLAIAFIDKHKHAYISNGAFILDSYDPSNNTGVMIANRDPAYPYARGYWTTALATHFARIDAINVPAYKKGSPMTVTLTVSDITYPSNKAALAAKGNVKVTLIGDRETSYTAKLAKAGSFQAVIPAKDLDALKAGSYTLVVEAALGTETAAVDTSNVIIF